MRTVTRWAGLSGQPMNRFSEHAGERAQTQAEWSTRNREYVAVISGCSSLLMTRSHLNHDGSVRKRFSGREAKSQSAYRRAGSRKGKESATLASIIKGNCGQFPYWTLFGTHYRCRNGVYLLRITGNCGHGLLRRAHDQLRRPLLLLCHQPRSCGVRKSNGVGLQENSNRACTACDPKKTPSPPQIPGACNIVT